MDARKAAAGMVLLAIMVSILWYSAGYVHPQPSEADGVPDEEDRPETVGEAMWEDRALDVLVQMAVILAGAFGVLALVREVKSRD